MGSYTRFGDDGFWEKDSVLEIWFFFLWQAATANAELPPWLTELAEHWLSQSKGGFTGFTCANIDNFHGDEEKTAVLRGIASAALEDLASMGDAIPYTILRDAGVGSGARVVWSRDVPTERIMQAGVKFVQLLLD